MVPPGAGVIAIPNGGTAVECEFCHGGRVWGLRCETCNGHGYVVTENDVENAWSNLGEEAMDIADVVMTASDQLERSAQRLQVLIAKAADTPTDDSEGGNESLKRQTLLIWRATLESVRNAQDALTSKRK